MTAIILPTLGEEVFPGQTIGQFDTTGATEKTFYIVVTIHRESRLIRELLAPGDGDTISANPTYKKLPGPHEMMVFWGPDSRVGSPVRGHYLPYPSANGERVPTIPDPVNQFAVGYKWRNILSRFAHDIMSFNPSSNHLRSEGTHTTGHLPPTDAAAMLKNKATYQLGRAVVGVAFHRVEHWLSFDAQRLAQYPATVPDSENWKIWQDGIIPVAEDEIQIPNISDMMAMLCGDAVKEIAGLCTGAWMYLLNERIEASSYDSNMNSGGEIRLPDPAWDLWRPNVYLHRVTGTRSERQDQWGEIMGWFTNAHDHYLASVAPSIEHN